MSYSKNTWVSGDKVTAAKLNNVENGIEANETAITAQSDRIDACEDGTGILVEQGYFPDAYKAVDNHFGTYTYKYISATNVFEMDRDESAGTKKVSIGMGDSGITLANRLISISDYPVCIVHVDTNIPQAANPIITVNLYQSNGSTLNHNYNISLSTGAADYTIDIAKKIADNHWQNDVYYVIHIYTSDSYTYTEAPYIHASNYGFFTANQAANLNLKEKIEVINSRLGTLETDVEVVEGKISGVVGEVNLADETNVFFGWLTATGGTETPSASLQERCTGFIKVNAGTSYILQAWVKNDGDYKSRLCYYDSSKTFISREDAEAATATIGSELYFRKVISPETGVAYIRFTARTYGQYKFKFERGYATTDWTPGFGSIINPPAYNGAITEPIYGIIHRGCGENQTAPENTIPGFIWGKKAGFGFCETDVRYTSDGVAVLLHDASINRTARNSDGTTISGTVNIADITYEQALQYDFGIYKGSEYAGTKIPTLEELIVLAKNIGLHVFLELKAFDDYETDIPNIISMLRGYRMLNHVSWIAGNYAYLFTVRDYDPHAHLCVLTSDNSAERDMQILSTLKTPSNEVSLSILTDFITSERIAEMKSRGISCNAYCPNTEVAMLAIDEFVTCVTSDKLNYAEVRKDDILGE